MAPTLGFEQRKYIFPHNFACFPIEVSLPFSFRLPASLSERNYCIFCFPLRNNLFPPTHQGQIFLEKPVAFRQVLLGGVSMVQGLLTETQFILLTRSGPEMDSS